MTPWKKVTPPPLPDEDTWEGTQYLATVYLFPFNGFVKKLGWKPIILLNKTTGEEADTAIRTYTGDVKALEKTFPKMRLCPTCGHLCVYCYTLAGNHKDLVHLSAQNPHFCLACEWSGETNLTAKSNHELMEKIAILMENAKSIPCH